MKSRLAVAALSLALLPAVAQAQTDPGNYTFNCGSGACLTVGNSFQGAGGMLYRLVVATEGDFEFQATGTAGDAFTFWISQDINDIGAGTKIGEYERGPNPIAVVGTVHLTPGTYYISAVAECTQDPSAACRTTLLPPGFDPGTVPDHTVPEPATMLLLGSGLAGVLGARRRKKNQQA